MKGENLIYTSICISEKRRIKFEECAKKLGVEEHVLFSILCYKGGMKICRKASAFKNVKYQKRGEKYEIKKIYLYKSDKEYICANRYSAKLSVSFIFRRAMDLYLDEIADKGINSVELAQLRIIKNSYRKKSYKIRNMVFSITQNSQSEDFFMKIERKKT
jgi:hypothetical protein